MKNHIRYLVMASAILGLVTRSALGSEPAKPHREVLDGRTFSGLVTESGKTKGDPDTLEFKAGTFNSTACNPYGFGSAPYKALKNKRGLIFFESTVHSVKSGKGELRWKGHVSGKTLAGTMTWLKGNGKAIEYAVKAEEK